MPERLTLTQYATPPLDVPSSIALVQSLLAATPKKAPEHVREAAADMREAADTLQAVWTARDASVPPSRTDPRPIDRLVDVVWSSLFWRLDTLAALPTDLYPRAERAAQLRDRLFTPGDRLGWLKKPYRAQWAEVKMRVDLIASDKLGKEIDDLAGPELRQEIERTFPLYGETLGITRPPPAQAMPESMLEKLRDVSAAISAYTIAVLSTIKRKEPATEVAAKTALQPLLTARESARRSPTAPVTPTPAPTPAPAPDQG